jgi:hypothetical protein
MNNQRIVVALLVVIAGISGCGEQAKPTPAPDVAAPAAGKPNDKKVSRPSGVMGVYDREKNRRLLDDIGKLCLVNDINKLPRTLDELKEIIKENGLARKAVESGEFVLVPNARASNESLFMYERDPDPRGKRLVLMGFGAVEEKTAEEFANLKR